MATAQGSNAQIQFGEEVTFKTQPGTPDGTLLPIISDGGLGQKTSLGSSNIIRGTRNPTKPFQNTRDISGSPSTELNPYMGTLFKHAIGSVATTGVDPYTHTFSVAALPVGLWIEKGFTDINQYFLYNGCRINSLGLSFSASGGVVPLSIDIMGAKQTIATSSTDATPNDLGHDPFMNFDAAIEEGGSTIATVTECSINISNNLDGNSYYIGGDGERGEIPAGNVGVTGSIAAMFDSITLYNKAVNFSESSLKVTLTKGDGLGSAGNESIEIFIPELIFEEQAPPIEGPQGVKVTLPFQSYYTDSAEASTVQVILKNATVSY